jgi:PAB-dependent poly(A)-specific ribonuclease subunit 3
MQTQSSGRFGGRQPSPHVPENVLWSYIVQLASAIKACHSLRLAVRTIQPNKIIVTSKNRIRLNACSILDIVQFDSQFQLEQLKQDDFVQLGRLILSIAGNANAALNIGKAMEHLTRTYTPKLRECVTWLVSTDLGVEKNIDTFLQGISSEMVQTLDMQLHESDTLTSTLVGELENGRLVRLVAKLGLINDRPEYEHNPQWSETGERYYLKLFRDYVFHAVDEQGRPVTDLGHIVSCLNKLDAGSDEKIQLMSRDEQSVFVVSYKEVKKGIETAFGELTRRR